MPAVHIRRYFIAGRFGPLARPLCAAIAALLVTMVVIPASRFYQRAAPVSRVQPRKAEFQQARLSQKVSIRAMGNRDSPVSLRDGRELLSAYEGVDDLQRALEQDLAGPRSLASADFDEDGVPDLVSGYDNAGRGIVTIHRGNVDSIYPNAPAARARRANGTSTEAPFLSASAFEVTTPADFLGAGDFNADGHWDIVQASRGGTELYFLPGDGKGSFGAQTEVSLGGRLTILATGEINRRDGLTDLVVGIAGAFGAQVLVFEGPGGALRSMPEVFEISFPATSLALGQLDGHYCSDLAVGAGTELHFVYGRDRKLSLDAKERASVNAARKESRVFSSSISSVALGDFVGSGGTDVALLLENGALELLDGAMTRDPQTNRGRSHLNDWQSTRVSGAYSGTGKLTRALVSSSANDDLLVSDFDGREFQVVSSPIAGQSKNSQRTIATVNSDEPPVAVLPMRLDSDALTDLVVLRAGKSSPVIVPTANSESGAPPRETPALDTFSNPAPISIPTSSSSPPKPASPYPSTINVSGLPGTISKLRVRLHGVTLISSEQDIDLLLVGPTGQKVLLVSDVDTICSFSNATLTFDDDATTRLESFNCVTGTYQPTDNAPADTFAAPAPAGPYQTTLSSFNGTNPNGTWSLYMVDDVGVFGIPHSIAGGWTLYFGPDSPATFVVTNTNTSGAGSLNQAVLDSNDHFGVDTITFNIPGSAPFTITPTLLSVTDPVTIDATTQPGGVAGQPNIELQGGFFFIEGGRTTIRGFVMNQTVGTNILIRKNGNNIIEGNYLGTNVSGLAAGGSQGGNGVEIDTANNVIGGTTAAARNIIGNKTHGIMFATFDDAATPDDDAANNLVQGNYIGVNVDGSAIIPISHAGVTSRSAPGSPNNTIGGTTAGAGNVISAGTSPSGVDLVYSGSHGYLVQGNFIGTDPTGTKPFISGFNSGNSFGLNIEGGTHDNLIGGTTPAARNIISGNSFFGVFFRDSTTNNNLVQGNFIGTDVTGTKAIASGDGVRMIFDASLNTIGGAVAGARNIISGNRTAGLQFGEPTKGGALNNVVQGNYIGTDVSGDLPLGNGGSPFFDDAGIIIPANSRGDRILGNRIAFNKGHGIRITNVSGGDINSIEIEIADNLIYGNQGLGIDLGGSGITPNDPLDADDGPNRLQNFPTLDSVTGAANPESAKPGDNEPDVTVTVNGTLNSAPNTAFTVHWYFSSDAQCTTNQQATRPLVTGKVPGVTTDASGNAPFSFPFDFPVGVNNGIVNCTATDPLGNTSEFSACLVVNSSPPPAVKLSTSSYAAAESVGSTTVTVTRSGSPSGTAAVNYTTSDTAGSNCAQLNTGKASSRCDYETTMGTLSFAAGETSKTISILIVDDAYGEGDENFSVTLSNASGVGLGSPNTATVTVTDNESTTGVNPIDQAGFFTRLHYYDFLNREPDASGLAFWTNEITSCGSNAQCIEIKRINVSAAFYLSIEFQDTGYLVERIYRAAYGNATGTSTLGGTHQLSVPVIRFNEFLPDTQEIGQGVVVGQAGWEAKLESNKLAFMTGFVQRTRFTTEFPANMTAGAFVDKLNQNAGNPLSPTERNNLVNSGMTRAQMLRVVAEDPDLNTAEFNRAFVLMQFFGYLRRNPNDAPDSDYTGYDFWLGKLNQFGGNFVNAEMVKAFIVSGEYKGRFGP